MGPCLLVCVADLASHRERGGVLVMSPAGVSRGEQRFTETISRLRFARAIPGLPAQLQGAPEMGCRLLAAEFHHDFTEAGQSVRLGGPVAGLAAHVKGLPDELGGLAGIAARAYAGDAEVGKRVCFTDPIASLAAYRQGTLEQLD